MYLDIIYENDTELAEWEALSKGYRKDIVFIINSKKYKVYIISMVRVQKGMEIINLSPTYHPWCDIMSG